MKTQPTLRTRTALVLSLAWTLGAALPVLAQDRPLDYEQVRADEALRDGVSSFHQGLYNRAILSFEEALRHKPAAPSPRKWLGEALWASGMEAQALNEWHHVLDQTPGDDVLAARVEVLEQRRGLDADLRTPDRYLPLYDLSGKAKDPQGKNLFLRPSSVRPLPDGGFLLTAFGSEEVVRVDSMGNLTGRVLGSLAGLRAPFDLLPWNGKTYVTQFTADQVVILDANGLVTKTFGGRGRKEGQLLGPQYLATDGQALYVTEWGNARVSKFDADGQLLLTFGRPAPGYAGMKRPTGIAASAGTVWVADQGRKVIDAFDPSGNWLATYGEGRLTSPEGLSLLDDGRLLVADGAKAQFLDPASDSLVPFDPEWNQGLRVTSAVLDANHNLVVADFDDNKVRVLAEGHTIYSGLSARVVRLNTKQYPQVTATFAVEDRWGRPITGLGAANFVLTESGTRIVTPQLSFQGFKDTQTDVALVIDRDPALARYDDEVKEAVGWFTETWADRGGVGLFPATGNPLPQNEKLSSVRENQRLATDPTNLTSQGKLDLAIRQAGLSLIPGVTRRTVVFVTAGTVGPQAFARSSLEEVAAFLKNNGVVFSVVTVSGGPLAPELEFLMKQTGGKSYSVQQPLTPFVADAADRVSNLYSLTWTSVTPSESGIREVPVTIEVQKFKQSARTNSSFFPPSNTIAPPKAEGTAAAAH